MPFTMQYKLCSFYFLRPQPEFYVLGSFQGHVKKVILNDFRWNCLNSNSSEHPLDNTCDHFNLNQEVSRYRVAQR